MNSKEKMGLVAVLSKRARKDATASMLLRGVNKISRDVALLRRFAEHECNVGELDTADRASEMRALARVSRVLEELGVHNCGLELNGDPRGYVLFLVFKGEDRREYANDWGQRGYGIG